MMDLEAACLHAILRVEVKLSNGKLAREVDMTVNTVVKVNLCDGVDEVA